VAPSLLTVLGRADLIAQTLDEYVAIACHLASDLPALAQERATLRERLLASPLGNADLYTRAVEEVYRTLWRGWCNEVTGYRLQVTGVDSPSPTQGEGLPGVAR
jgi:protein O-GlcNAc transferase